MFRFVTAPLSLGRVGLSICYHAAIRALAMCLIRKPASPFLVPGDSHKRVSKHSEISEIPMPSRLVYLLVCLALLAPVSFAQGDAPQIATQRAQRAAQQPFLRAPGAVLSPR